jgi:hypothetical protein
MGGKKKWYPYIYSIDDIPDILEFLSLIGIRLKGLGGNLLSR